MRCHRPGYFRMPRVLQDNPVVREKAFNIERYIQNAESGLPIFDDKNSTDTSPETDRQD